jgi:predicted transcriptional regulator
MDDTRLELENLENLDEQDPESIIHAIKSYGSDIDSMIEFLIDYNILDGTENDTLIMCLQECPELQRVELLNAIEATTPDNEEYTAILQRILEDVPISNQAFLLETISRLEEVGGLSGVPEFENYKVSKLKKFNSVSSSSK